MLGEEYAAGVPSVSPRLAASEGLFHGRFAQWRPTWGKVTNVGSFAESVTFASEIRILQIHCAAGPSCCVPLCPSGGAGGMPGIWEPQRFRNRGFRFSENAATIGVRS